MKTDTGLKALVLAPSAFFQDKLRTDENNLGAILIIALTFFADFATKTVLFYKIGANNIRSSAEWAEFGGGYFGQIIGQQIGMVLKLLLLWGAFYLIGRYFAKDRSVTKLINISGYCFVPWLVACSVLALVYALGLEIGFVDLASGGASQLSAWITSSPAYLGQRVIGFNAWVWTAILGAAMLGAYWKVKFIKSLIIMLVTVVAITGADRLAGMALAYSGWVK